MNKSVRIFLWALAAIFEIVFLINACYGDFPSTIIFCFVMFALIGFNKGLKRNIKMAGLASTLIIFLVLVAISQTSTGRINHTAQLLQEAKDKHIGQTREARHMAVGNGKQGRQLVYSNTISKLATNNASQSNTSSNAKHHPTLSYNAAYDQFTNSINMSHDDLVVSVNPTPPLIVTITLHQKSVTDMKHIGSEYYDKYRALRLRYSLPVSASECWVMVNGPNVVEGPVVRSDANGSRLAP